MKIFQAPEIYQKPALFPRGASFSPFLCGPGRAARARTTNRRRPFARRAPLRRRTALTVPRARHAPATGRRQPPVPLHAVVRS